MIAFENVNFSYAAVDESILRRLNLRLSAGDFVLVRGETGSGKSTFLKLFNGLAPNFTGGRIGGSIHVNGEEIIGTPPHDLAQLIGYVNQQPEAAFATDTVEEELAFGMEQLGIESAIMANKVGEVAELFGLRELLTKPLSTLSGGQQQRVAIGSAIAAGQRILILDEPTSALDSASAEALLRLLADLARNQGMLVVLAEHRVERVLPLVDYVLTLRGDGTIERRGSAALLDARPVQMIASAAKPGPLLIECKGLREARKNGFELGPIDLSLAKSSITVIFGDNGAGKTTLLWALMREAQVKKVVTVMVPQNASDLLILNSVADELAVADQAGTQSTSRRTKASEIFERLVGRQNPTKHPRDLSVGQQLALALAIQMSRPTDLLLLDEPTRGLDEKAKAALAAIIGELRESGVAIAIATHDQIFAKSLADFTIALEDGLASQDVGLNG